MLIGLSRMRSILEVDLDNGKVLAEPGVTNIAVSQAVGPTHFYPPDLSSQIVCTIGGNVPRTPAARTASSTGSPPTT